MADSFQIENFKVARNQNLASILLAQNVEYPIIYQLAEKSKEKFDVRRIRTGNPYAIFYSRDTLKTPLWFVYEIDKTDFLVMQLTDSLDIIRDRKPIEVVRKSGTGIITSSLWNTINENNLHPVLAMELSEIYAWTVDFFGIEKGDKFRVIYDEQYVDSVSIGIDAIHAAHFNHKGREYYAFHFKEDSVWSYFDEAGNSLRKAFLKAPLKFSRISSRFSNNRFHPVLKINRPHHGVDYAAPSGTPVYAIGDGTVTNRGWDPKGGGNFIKIRHNSVYTSLYMHLQGFGKGIKKGGFVQQGQLIGYVGSTGLSTGPHLDFRMYRSGSAVDPLKIEAPPVDPIQEDSMAEYLEYIEPLFLELQQLKQYTSPPAPATKQAVAQ
ncbi:peptidase, M23/M37 family [Geofilum rubicundum JCM 15548]|uniref:Peptidase, M23/M37 family n=1 Tax=Geofilum rubicundum JCM 15548 TaxID=1236989 RepID=A0A0E9LR41_9BACT|nr:peptidase, M23/M37 family [Geofilum rubicundum JCM 15548]